MVYLKNNNNHSKMSLSISDILKPLGDIALKHVKSKLLNNPDIPILQKKFDDKKEIRDKAFSAMKLTSAPRNGTGFRLPRTTFNDDPRLDAFLMDGAIDPNVIRKRVNPDRAIPSLESAESTLFSLVPDNLKSHDFVNLVKTARKSYINYKNRFFVEDKNPPNQIQPKNKQIDTAKTAVPTKTDFKPIIYDTGDDELPERGDGSRKDKDKDKDSNENHQAPINPIKTGNSIATADWTGYMNNIMSGYGMKKPRKETDLEKLKDHSKRRKETDLDKLKDHSAARKKTRYNGLSGSWRGYPL